MPDNNGFIDYIWPHAIAASEATGVDPRIIAGQAAVETGWGQHFVGNNLFGIKGPGTQAQTVEIVNGQPQVTTANFRSFATPADSVSGYASFLNENPRYAAFKNAGDVNSQLAALGSSGYATDPGYAGKVANAAAAIDGVVRKQANAGWGKPGEGTPTDIGTALGYTGSPVPTKAAAVTDSSDFFKDMGIDPNAKKPADSQAAPESQGSDFLKIWGLHPRKPTRLQRLLKRPAALLEKRSFRQATQRRLSVAL